MVCSPISRLACSNTLKECKITVKENQLDWVDFPKGEDVPDVFYDPKRSLVVCINGSSIIISNDGNGRPKLRFPVFARIRQDKTWDSIMTMSGRCFP